MIDKEIIKIASNTENHGLLDNHTHFSKKKNPISGDNIKVYLIVKNNKKLRVKYQFESCIYCQASVSLLSRYTKNKSVDEVKIFALQTKGCFNKDKKKLGGEWKEFNKIMTINNISRKECLLLPINAMLEALVN